MSFMFSSSLEHRGRLHPQLWFTLFVGFVVPDATSVAEGTEAEPENQQPVPELSDLVSLCLFMGTDVLEGIIKQILKLLWHVLLHLFVTWEKAHENRVFFYEFEEQAMSSQVNVSVEDS